METTTEPTICARPGCTEPLPAPNPNGAPPRRYHSDDCANRHRRERHNGTRESRREDALRTCERLLNEPLRERFLALEARGELTCGRLGIIAGYARVNAEGRLTPDTSGVQRKLGLRPNAGAVHPADTIAYDDAMRLGLAMGMDPHEFDRGVVYEVNAPAADDGEPPCGFLGCIEPRDPEGGTLMCVTHRPLFERIRAELEAEPTPEFCPRDWPEDHDHAAKLELAA